MKATGTCVWPKKQIRRVLVGEAGGGGELVEDVAPALRAIEGRVDDREVGDHAHVLQVAQPLAVLGRQLLAGPVHRLGGGGIEAIQRLVGRAILVVVALDDGHVHLADDVQAFLGIGVVADHVAQAGVMGALLLLDVLQNDLERLKVGVYVGYNCKLHVSFYLTISNPRNSPAASAQDTSSSRIKWSSPDSRIACRNASSSSLRAFGDQFHPAVGQIADRAGHVEAGGDRFHGVAEPDTLHLARVNNLHSPAIHSIDPSNVPQSVRFREENRLSAGLTQG